MIYLNDKYRIVPDGKCYILQEKKIVQKGENAGQETWSTICYPSTIESACDSYMRHTTQKELQSSEGMAVNEALQTLKELWQQCLKEIKEMVSE